MWIVCFSPIENVDLSKMINEKVILRAKTDTYVSDGIHKNNSYFANIILNGASTTQRIVEILIKKDGTDEFTTIQFLFNVDSVKFNNEFMFIQ